MSQAVPPSGLADLVPAPCVPACERVWFGTPAADDADVVLPAEHLAEHLDLLLAGARTLYAGDDARALLSQWSKLHFNLVIPPVLIAARVLGRPLALTGAAVVLKGGLPHALWLPHGALGEPCGEPAVLYRSLCVEHLAPLISALARAVRLAPRVLWNNAANTLEYALRYELPDGGADLAYLFEQRDWFDTGTANPLYRAIRYVDTVRAALGSPFRSRHVCCLRDRLPGELHCAACPLLLTMADEELVEQMRLHTQE